MTDPVGVESVVRAQWQAPDSVAAFTTTRYGPGRSLPPFDRFNLGDHVGDNAADVAHNRVALRELYSLPSEPLWLRQVHGTAVVDADCWRASGAPEADAVVTRQSGRVLAILTADCLPVVFAADDGSVLAAAHAGWRGLAAGVLEATLAAMRHPRVQIAAWIGPGIRQDAFEVGPDVREAFIARDKLAFAAFKPSDRRGHFHCDLALLARQRLMQAGLSRIADCGLCTHTDAKRFYSHRRDQHGGRQATLVWIR